MGARLHRPPQTLLAATDVYLEAAFWVRVKVGRCHGLVMGAGSEVQAEVPRIADPAMNPIRAIVAHEHLSVHAVRVASAPVKAMRRIGRREHRSQRVPAEDAPINSGGGQCQQVAESVGAVDPSLRQRMVRYQLGALFPMPAKGVDDGCIELGAPVPGLAQSLVHEPSRGQAPGADQMVQFLEGRQARVRGHSLTTPSAISRSISGEP